MKKPRSEKTNGGVAVPVYEERIVTFIDILGFAKDVEKSDNKTLPSIEKKVKVFRNSFYSKKHHPRDDKGLLVLFFSDSMLRARTIDYSPLFWEVLSAVHGIANIVINGHFVRGAMTHGNFYYDQAENILISPAFIEAYKGEQSQASVPRVIVDPRTLETLKTRKDWWQDLGGYPREAKSLYSLLRLDTDGYYFIDYLKCIESELDDPPSEYPWYVKKHKELIEIALSSKLPLDVRKKYIWLGNYHNKVLAEWGNAGPLKGCEVPDSALKL